MHEVFVGAVGLLERDRDVNSLLFGEVDQINATLGSYYLPKIVPALKPFVSRGYIGVKHVRPWRYKKTIPAEEADKKEQYSKAYAKTYTNNDRTVYLQREKAAESVATLQYGARHSGFDWYQLEDRKQQQK